MSALLAAFTIASTSSVVISASRTSMCNAQTFQLSGPCPLGGGVGTREARASRAEPYCERSKTNGPNPE
jgi:hypothetical protein